MATEQERLDKVFEAVSQSRNHLQKSKAKAKDEGNDEIFHLTSGILVFIDLVDFMIKEMEEDSK